MSAAKTLVGPCWKGLVGGLVGGLVSDKVFVGRLFCRMSAAKILVGPCRKPVLQGLPCQTLVVALSFFIIYTNLFQVVC